MDLIIKIDDSEEEVLKKLNYVMETLGKRGVSYRKDGDSYVVMLENGIEEVVYPEELRQ
jgi:hypothetical protein